MLEKELMKASFTKRENFSNKLEWLHISFIVNFILYNIILNKSLFTYIIVKKRFFFVVSTWHFCKSGILVIVFSKNEHLYDMVNWGVIDTLVSGI